MASAKKLPSGAWRTLATKVIGNKKVRKSFTVHPDECRGDSRKAKALSEMMAREWQTSVVDDQNYGISVGSAIEKYINDRSKVLSPSTITNYRLIQPLFEPIADIYISDLKTADIQTLVNEWSVNLTAKTIKNRTGLLLSALDYAECDRKFKLRYPNKPSKEVTSPDVEDVKRLLAAASDDFRPVLYLAAFGGLRRGEIAALKQEDISRDLNRIFVHADIVLNDHDWVYKPFPKNGLSGIIQLPKFIIESLPEGDPESYVFNMNPSMISHKYARTAKKAGVEYNLHSLRHFAASFRSDAGIPKKYIEEVGRWKSGSAILDRVYDNALDSSRKKYTDIANKYIEDNFRNIS